MGVQRDMRARKDLATRAEVPTDMGKGQRLASSGQAHPSHASRHLRDIDFEGDGGKFF